MNVIDLLKGHLTPELVGKAAGFLGESNQATSKGFDAAIPAILGGILNQSGNSSSMGKIWDLLNHKDNDPGLLNNLGGLFSGTSALSSSNGIGSTLLNLVLGNNQSGILSAISSLVGFNNSGSAGKLLGMAAPLIMGFLKKKSNDENYGVSGLTTWLGGQKSAINAALPAGLSSVLGFANLGTTSGSATKSTASVSSNNSDDNGGGSNWWMWLVGLLAALGLLWGLMKGCNKTNVAETVKTTVDNVAAAVDSAAIKAAEAAKAAAEAAKNMYTGVDSAVRVKWLALGDMMKATLPGGIELNVPANGVENSFITWINDASKPVDKTTWFNLDRILFETGSANLNSASKEQLMNVAAILKAYPNVNVKIGGYTDNQGDAAKNKALSAARAKEVMNTLVGLGIDAKRMESEGYGQEHPVTDNSTPEGREQNRRVALRVTKK
ncbi:MAG TPA: OmpA family protein [Saprospiraceae bacterium]|nr:OmpA family protein [Saprospiraceae bacterium]